jgi:hypothetical protein
MPKYRLLYREELEDLKLEFIRFLSAHSITAPDWEKMKEEDPDKSANWIELFSDMVFDTVLKKIELLELRTETEIKFLTFDEKNTNMVGLKIEGTGSINLTKNENASEMISRFQQEGGELRIITGERPHEDSRELEVFKNMALGYLISKNKELHHSLNEIISERGE